MPHVELNDDCLKIELGTLDKIWAIHGSLEIPIAHIVGAQTVDESGWGHLWRKVIGTNAPGIKMAGTFYINGGLAFLDYGSGDQCIVLQTVHETYKTVIVQPDPGENSKELVAQILARISG